jgi:hypothetical protein
MDEKNSAYREGVPKLVKVINKVDYQDIVMCVPGNERRLAGWR